jgi:hypothetical protein
LQVKFFTDVYDSDVIVASPLALATQLGEGGAGAADYLSSIELLVMFRGDVMHMQNWAHVETVFEALNKMPSEQHGTDIMRVRCVPLCLCQHDACNRAHDALYTCVLRANRVDIMQASFSRRAREALQADGHLLKL